jgi:DNA-binding MurR/RpiR family transcriptional regulator
MKCYAKSTSSLRRLHARSTFTCGTTASLVVPATVDRALAFSVAGYEEALQLLGELRKQGANVIGIANAGDREIASLVTDCIEIAAASEYLLSDSGNDIVCARTGE